MCVSDRILRVLSTNLNTFSRMSRLQEVEANDRFRVNMSEKVRPFLRFFIGVTWNYGKFNLVGPELIFLLFTCWAMPYWGSPCWEDGRWGVRAVGRKSEMRAGEFAIERGLKGAREQH